MNKPRPDKKLNLGPEKEEQLFQLLKTPGVSYARAKQWVLKEWGLDVSIRALSEFWEAMSEEEATERTIKARMAADAFGAASEENMPAIAKGLKAKLMQYVFELVNAGADEKRVTQLMSVIGSMDKGQLEEAKLKLEREKFAEQMRGDIDRGLQALFDELRGDAQAVELFNKLRERVKSITARAA